MPITTEKVYGGTGFMTGEATARQFARTAASMKLGTEATHATLLQTMESQDTRRQTVQKIAGQTAGLNQKT